MAKIAINGLGRIGKLVLRAFIDEGFKGEIVLVNDVAGEPALHAHLLEFDTVHGRWPARFGLEGCLATAGLFAGLSWFFSLRLQVSASEPANS